MDPYSTLKTLNEQRMYASAEQLGSLIVSTGRVSAEVLDEYSAALYGLKEHQRCLQVCNSLVDIYKTHKDEAAKQRIAKIRLRMASCFRKLKNMQGALSIYRALDTADHTVESLMIMARLVATFEGRKPAEKILREVVRRSPWCVEALQLLVEMGVPVAELWPAGKGRLEDTPIGKMLSAVNEYRRLAAGGPVTLDTPAIVGVEKEFPSNTYLLKAKAIGCVSRGSLREAHVFFTKLRTHDRTFMEDMDTFAYILKKHGTLEEVAALVRDMIRTNPNRSECWTSTAIYYEMQGKRDAALTHATRAIAINARSTIAYLVRGDIQLGMGELYAAYNSYRQAWGLQKYIWTADGLVTALLSMHDEVKANFVVGEVSKQLGKDHPSTLILQATVLALTTDQLDNAAKMLTLAAEKEPNSSDAIIGLAQIYRRKNETDKAREILTTFIEKRESTHVYVALGDIAFSQLRIQESTHYYREALRINKYNDLAQSGLRRIEVAQNIDEGEEEEEDEAPMAPGDEGEEDEEDDEE